MQREKLHNHCIKLAYRPYLLHIQLTQRPMYRSTHNRTNVRTSPAEPTTEQTFYIPIPNIPIPNIPISNIPISNIPKSNTYKRAHSNPSRNSKSKLSSNLPRSNFLNPKTKGRSEERPILVGYSHLLLVVRIVPKDCHEHECTEHDYRIHRRLDDYIFLHSASFNRVAQGASGLPYTNSGISSPSCVLR